jgi:ligand-binding sensor domain-containing protein
LQGSQRALIWPEANSDSRLRELTSLGQDANGRLLIGTASAGIFVFDGKQTTTESAFEKLKGDAIWSLLVDGAVVWIASGKGLFLFQSGQLKDVVPGINARSLSISAGSNRSMQVWCATVGNGLFKVALTTNSAQLFLVWTSNRVCPRNARSRFGPKRRRRDSSRQLPAPAAALSAIGPIMWFDRPARASHQPAYSPTR